MNRPISTVFLDRDGVINRKAPANEYIQAWDQFEFLPGVVDALRLLRVAGVRVIVVTNQRGVALGHMSLAAVQDIHRRMNGELAKAGAAVDAILVCPHDEGVCECRKPRLGLYRDAKALFPDLDPGSSVVVGDSAIDVMFGNQLGSPTYLVADPTGSTTILASTPGLRISGIAPTLLELVQEQLVRPATGVPPSSPHPLRAKPDSVSSG